MFSYVLKRILLLIPVLFTVATLVFFFLRLIPGDPVDFILGENSLPADRQRLISQAHFDKPITEQYVLYWRSILDGDLGRSYFSGEPVTSLIARRFPQTMQLAFLAVLWAMILSFPLGVFAALNKGKWPDSLALVVSLIGISAPSFYLGPLLVLVLSIKMDLLPVAGTELAGSFILPSITLGTGLSALLTRMIRSSLLDGLKADYIRTARAKGLAYWRVVLKHALRTALVPVVAILGLQFGALLAGAIITEKIFSWPGMGTLLLDAISQRDYGVVQGCILVIATTYVVVNLLTDLLYSFLDPRVEVG